MTREAVIEAAIRLMDESGEGDFKFRDLGKMLNVNSTSLYHHFANKDEILQAAVRYSLRTVHIEAYEGDWKAWIAENAVQTRRFLVTKPYLISLMLAGYRPRTMAVKICEEKLAEGGMPAELRDEFIFALDMVLLGSALLSVTSAHGPHLGGREPSSGRVDYEQILRMTIGVLLSNFNQAVRIP